MQPWPHPALARDRKMRYNFAKLAGIDAQAPTPYDIEAESPGHPWPANGGPKALPIGSAGANRRDRAA